jgi:hypothetical protein
MTQLQQTMRLHQPMLLHQQYLDQQIQAGAMQAQRQQISAQDGGVQQLLLHLGQGNEQVQMQQKLLLLQQLREQQPQQQHQQQQAELQQQLNRQAQQESAVLTQQQNAHTHNFTQLLQAIQIPGISADQLKQVQQLQLQLQQELLQQQHQELLQQQQALLLQRMQLLIAQQSQAEQAAAAQSHGQLGAQMAGIGGLAAPWAKTSPAVSRVSLRQEGAQSRPRQEGAQSGPQGVQSRKRGAVHNAATAAEPFSRRPSGSWFYQDVKVCLPSMSALHVSPRSCFICHCRCRTQSLCPL